MHTASDIKQTITTAKASANSGVIPRSASHKILAVGVGFMIVDQLSTCPSDSLRQLRPTFASRLVGVAKDKGVEIVLSGETWERADRRLDARSLGETVVRGKSQPVPIFTLDRKSPPI
ncbi:hypothetical protein [Rhizobium leguminosarum]|uniref:hypothetical protein n=1 Tax=Rhizobium leguminosarum TaxID=384 RepID=UPI001C9805B9|nr:hypothetical protein [Rhizobium leguminosarum]MBY5440167.1 hypothetical protein [Rhizobium leguminosarum]